MPNGVMLWFDAGSGDGRIEASGRQYPAHEYDVEPRARTAGARVHFDVERVKGVPVAVRVTAVPGTRTTTRQRRYGDLTGARRPDDKGRPPLTHQGGATDPPATGQPVALVRRWIAGADSGHLDAVLPLYAPDAVLHTTSGDHHGRAAIRAFLLDSGLLTRGWSATPIGSATTVAAVRGPVARDARRVNRFRIAHGEIAEQWDEPADETGES
ncbi:MAG TPA: nuclear transport factor 2 family protein [Euzebyales bacterium]|nr:nuclear transport factor 2 family protein [Euzebyales bacterium]